MTPHSSLTENDLFTGSTPVSAGSFSFDILGPVQGKGRPIFARRGNHVSVRTPAKTVSYEQLVVLSYQIAGGAETPVRSGPIAVSIAAFMDRPKGHYGKGRNEGKLKTSAPAVPTKKPDGDNIAKIICDALNKIAFNDDAQICELHVSKRYAEPSATPYARVTISEL